MTEKEFLLVSLMEACADVQKACAKILRFGQSNYHPNHPDRLNDEALLHELLDLETSIALCEAAGCVVRRPLDSSGDATRACARFVPMGLRGTPPTAKSPQVFPIESRVQKRLHWLDYAKRIGHVKA